ncbi:Transcriptional effector CCR4-related protein [Plasmopara halstedii]|uniref:Transcriptional effector CCR4-related protein n=1 Tax=Plasmopara halstedii TaxID=4781 RepID=A0A0P1ADG2_PLAHL|nr:Transcriptional effector CCR4-related protein [Plasmopara halstedii]CEG38734.1 Transcriptional effector CCR4-related protein [Plasmopara halstedii]|eukprot:XP_024575103.1 Transcriptional effector CCR4-related protein [Plasmopara halstedii]
MAIGSELIEAMRRRRSLSLMTFNLLAPCYFRHGGRLESDYSTSFLARAQAAISAIKREKCDVICLQEFWFDHDYQCAFRQAFQRTHQIHTVKRPGDKQDGLAIFVDKSKLEVHNVESVDLVEEAGDRVALLLHVATKWNRKIVPLSQRSLLIVNSHLTFPHSDMYTSLRLNEINRVLLAMRKLVTNHKFYSIFAHLHGREARITHCNHNNSEVSVDFIFSNRIKIGQEIKGDGIVRDNSILHLQPVDCHLVPRQLPDVARLKRPQFGHDWHSVQSPTLLREERDLVDYWRMVSDHRPLVAKFDMTERFKETSRN